MTELRLIFAKDLRRLRWLLAAWLVVVAARVVLRSVSADVAFTANILQLAVDNISTLLGLVDVLLLLVLVSRLIHDEPLVNPDAFWLTRPIRPTMLMTTKLVFAALWLVLAPVFVQSVATVAITHDVREMLTALASTVVGQLLWVVMLVTIATLTPSVTRFLLTLIGAVAVLVLTLSATLTSRAMWLRIEGPLDTVLPDNTGAVLLTLLALIVAAAVMASQYRRRQLRRSIVTGAICAAVGTVIVSVWPWRFAKPTEPDPSAWTRNLSLVAPVLDRTVAPYISDPFPRRVSASSAPKEVAVPIRMTGIPATYSTTMSIHARLAFADGSDIESAQTGQASVRPNELDDADDSEAPLRAALAPARPLMRVPWRYANWPVALVVSDTDLTRRGSEPGRLSLAVTVFLYETGVVGSLPLVESATTPPAQHAPRFQLRRVVFGNGTCSVLIRRTGGVDYNTRGYRYRFVLRNRRRAEFMSGDDEPIGSRGIQLAGLVTLTQTSGGGDFSDLIVYYPQRSAGTMPVLDAEWLRDADIAIVDTTYRGKLSRSLTIDGFKMKP